MSRRDWRAYAVFVGWLLLSLVSIQSGRLFTAHGWGTVPVSLGPVSGIITLFPPTFFCTAILFGLGLEWALIPAFLSSFIVNCEGGLTLGWATMVALGDPLEIALTALAYRSSGIAFDLRSRTSVCWFIAVAVLSNLAGSLGGLVWSEWHAFSGAETVRIWMGWFSGGVSLTLLVMPVLWLGARKWMEFRRALAPAGERPLASFRFTTTAVTAAGLMVAAFLAGSNYIAATRLSATLETGVLPKVQDRIWAAVAGWQIAAWSAIFLIALITVGTLILSRWWSQRWITQNAALRAAVEAANLAAKAKGDFLATMSHELRTPMHGVLGLDELLLSTNLDDEQRDYALLIDKSARSLMLLLDEVLDFSKIEAGKLELHNEEFDLHREVKTVFLMLQPRAHLKGLALELSIDDEVPRKVLGDPDRIRQVLMNLAGNAIKFTEQGSVRISVTGKPAGSVRFVVEDSGPGIDPDTVKRLFLPFTQGDSSMSRKHGGTGLGLSISKQLVELMSGAISTKSEVGEGSEFAFTIPLPPVGLGDAADDSVVVSTSLP